MTSNAPSWMVDVKEDTTKTSVNIFPIQLIATMYKNNHIFSISIGMGRTN